VKLRQVTIEKSGDVMMRLGEAAIIGAAASAFLPAVSLFTTLAGIIGGFALVSGGLALYNIADKKGR